MRVEVADAPDAPPPIDDELIRGVLGCMTSSRLIFLYRPDVREPAMWWSPGAATLLGYAAGELGPSIEALHALVHPNDLSTLLNRAREIGTQSDSAHFTCEYRLRCKQGEYLWVRSVMGTRRPPDAQQPIASLEVIRVDEQGRSADRAALKLSEDALSTVLNEIGYPVVLMNSGGVIVQANDAAARFSGPPDAVAGFCPFLHRDDGHLLFPGFLEDVIRHGQPMSRELQRFERWWHVHLVPIRDADHQVARVLLLAQDITGIKAAQVLQLERERALRNTLIREIHHRIKNHLQGLIGLLRRHARPDSSAAEQMSTAVAQIRSIAAIHGLLAKSSKASVDIGSLVKEIVTATRATSPLPVLLACEPAPFAPLELSEGESISLAVALGELLTNAVKHTEPVAGAQVRVAVEGHADRVELTITNSPAHLPPQFRLEAWASGQSGLALVLTLLSHRHVHLSLEQHAADVVAKLEFRAA